MGYQIKHGGEEVVEAMTNCVMDMWNGGGLPEE